MLIKMLCVSTRRTITKELPTWQLASNRKVFLAALQAEKYKMRGAAELREDSF